MYYNPQNLILDILTFLGGIGNFHRVLSGGGGVRIKKNHKKSHNLMILIYIYRSTT